MASLSSFVSVVKAGIILRPPEMMAKISSRRYFGPTPTSDGMPPAGRPLRSSPWQATQYSV
jgi:hypothetical protein